MSRMRSPSDELVKGVPPYARYYRTGKKLNAKFMDRVATEIISSGPFERLADVSFLGAISYVRQWLDSNQRIKESRFDHSVGVARLAEKFAEIVGLGESDRKVVVAAALLHDIGHPPLSHSAENAFESRFGVNHHDLTLRLIRGEERIGRVIPRILENNAISVKSVIQVLDGGTEYEGYKLFAGAFNLDTLEGISRCSAYLSDRVSESIPSPVHVLRASLHASNPDAVPVLDCFWRMKDRIYNEFIRNDLGIRADYMANSYFRNRNRKVSREVLLITESELRKQHPKLFRDLFSFDRESDKSRKSISYIQRRFVVNPDFLATQPDQRYTQVKTPSVLPVLN